MADVQDDSGPAGVPAEVRALATSPHPPDRAEAGRRLAARAGRHDVDDLLLQLLLDPSNTLVTHETAEALLERRDRASTRIIARAAALADPRDLSIEWLGDAVHDVWLQRGDDVRTALALAIDLSDDPEPVVREGAEKLRARIESGGWPRARPTRRQPADEAGSLGSSGGRAISTRMSPRAAEGRRGQSRWSSARKG